METVTTTEESGAAVFSRRLKRLRKKRGISLRVLADLCVTSKDTIRRYENGECVPNIETAARIAEHFGVSLDYLCGQDGSRQ